MPKLVVLWTDWVLLGLLLALGWYARRVSQDAHQRATWLKVLRSPSALSAGLVLAFFAFITLADSVHFRRALPPAANAPAGAPTFYATQTESLLDAMLSSLVQRTESQYSAPLATHGFNKEAIERGGQMVRENPRLKYGGAHLADPATQWGADVALRSLAGVAAGLLAGLACVGVLAYGLRKAHGGIGQAWRDIWTAQTTLPWRPAAVTWLVMCSLAGAVVALMSHYHVLGTDRTGNDVLYQALKSIRTAFVIGTLATLATLPLAVGLGVLAGYLRGWVDEVVQYLYTLLSSVPNVLLIAACVLMMQVYLDKNPEVFETGVERSDAKMFVLCVILGLTGWATLCRLVRGETLKLRELEYVQAATAFGVSPWRIMMRHIVPNVMHLVLITTVLSFSDLILYEAVLTYVGVGVDPSMNSFGGMINLARSEMSRNPVVWWSFAAAFGFMLTLVLAANLFADGVRDAFDPRARIFRPTLRRKKAAEGSTHAAG